MLEPRHHGPQDLVGVLPELLCPLFADRPIDVEVHPRGVADREQGEIGQAIPRTVPVVDEGREGKIVRAHRQVEAEGQRMRATDPDTLDRHAAPDAVAEPGRYDDQSRAQDRSIGHGHALPLVARRDVGDAS